MIITIIKTDKVITPPSNDLFELSYFSINCIAMCLGAPVSVPAGKVSYFIVVIF